MARIRAIIRDIEQKGVYSLERAEEILDAEEDVFDLDEMEPFFINQVYTAA